MAESKRTFQSAKMDKDIDDRLLPPGTYRDALNVSVEFSEDGNVGALENLKGNELLANQDITGLSSSSNPNATVIGSYAHPEENKIYYFVTGDVSDAIFEYDASTDPASINTIIIDSSNEPIAEQKEFKFSHAGVTVEIFQDGTIKASAKLGTPSVTESNFTENTTSSPITKQVAVRVKVPLGYKNQRQYVYGSVSAIQPAKSAPTPNTGSSKAVSSSTAKIKGFLDNNDIGVTAVGFYWGYTNDSDTALTVSELKTAGSGRTINTATLSSVTGDFESTISGIPANKLISYTAFATNSVGSGEGAVKTFTTSAAPAYNQLPNNKIFIFPAPGDSFEEGFLYPGYGEFEKADGGFYFAAVASDSSGLYTNYNDLTTGVTWSSTGPATLTFSDTYSNNFAKTNSVNTTTTTDGVYTITAAKSGLTSGTTQIVKGSPSGTRYKSTFTLNFAKTGTGTVPFVAVFDHSSATALHWNDGTISPSAVFSIGPFEQGQKGVIMIPLSTDNTVTHTGGGTTAEFNSGNFDPLKLDVSITGKTEGTDYDYYIATEAMSTWGGGGLTTKVPAVIVEADPYVLNSATANVTHTLNITYNY